MAGTTIGNLFRKPATLMYPVKPRIYFDATRGHLSIDFEKCIFCTICEKKCPTDAIRVDRPNKIWKIEHLKCIACGSCTENCPKKCLSIGKTYRPPVTAETSIEMTEEHRGA